MGADRIFLLRLRCILGAAASYDETPESELARLLRDLCQ